MLSDSAAGPLCAGDEPGVFCLGLVVVSLDGATTDVPNSEEPRPLRARPN